MAANRPIGAHLQVPADFPLLSLARRAFYQNDDQEMLADYLAALHYTELFQYQMDPTLN